MAKAKSATVKAAVNAPKYSADRDRKVIAVSVDGVLNVDGVFLHADPWPAEWDVLNYNGQSLILQKGTEHRTYPSVTPELWESYVAPVLMRHANAKAEKDAADALALAKYNSEEGKFARLRDAVRVRLREVDFYFVDDYPLDDLDADFVVELKAYRQALRDMTDQPGAPWDGGGDETPWPEKPVKPAKS